MKLSSSMGPVIATAVAVIIAGNFAAGADAFAEPQKCAAGKKCKDTSSCKGHSGCS